MGDSSLTVLTFHLVCLSWVFFRARTFVDARSVLSAICDPDTFFKASEIGLFKAQNWIIGIVFPFLILLCSRFHKVDKSLKSYPPIVAVGIVFAMLIIISLITGGANEFIYFQF